MVHHGIIGTSLEASFFSPSTSIPHEVSKNIGVHPVLPIFEDFSSSSGAVVP
jgi:hypothetical protein